MTITEGMQQHMKVCALVGVLEPDTTPFDAFMLSGEILGAVERDLGELNHELQQEKKAEGDAEFYLYNYSLEVFLEAQDAEYLANVRRRIGR
jgi:hypothetical protein